MNQHPEQFGRGLLEPDFEFGLNVMDAGQRKIVGKRAMAGNVKAAAHLLDLNVVHVDNFRKLAGQRFQPPLEFSVADYLVAGFNGGGLTLDVGENVGDLRHVVAHVRFQFRDLIVGTFEGHAFVEFDVLLDVKLSGEILHTDVVDVEVVTRGDGANAVEDIFRALGSRQRLHRYVSARKDVANGRRHCFHELLGALEGNGTGETDGEISEITVACATNSHASDFEHTIHVRDRVGDLGSDSGGSSVEQSVGGAAGQAPAHGNDDAGDK